MKYIFIIYLFDVLDVNILLYKFGQPQATLTQDKPKCLIIQDGGSNKALCNKQAKCKHIFCPVPIHELQWRQNHKIHQNPTSALDKEMIRNL